MHTKINLKKFTILFTVIATFAVGTILTPSAYANASLEDFIKVDVPRSYLNTGDNASINIQTGAGAYTYPLEVPPGTNGLTPKLVLSYNSLGLKGALGSVGAGWDLSLGYIQRDVNFTPSNLADDKFRLVLEGKSYDLVSTGQNIYHTKIESNLYIKRESTGGQNTKGEYWTVKLPTGTSYRFGYKLDSENMCSNRDYVWRWSLESITDTHGNNVYFSYAENPNANDIGAVYPLKVEYNNDKKRVVQFTLDSTDRPDAVAVYDQGCAVKMARRIKEVAVTANGLPVRKYAIGYTATLSNRSLLQTVTYQGKNGSSLPSTSFQYNQADQHWNTTPAKWAAGVPSLFAGLGAGTILADVTGDGLPDIVYSDSSAGWRVYRNTGTGWSTTYEQWAPKTVPYLYSDIASGTVLADITGDGLPDIVTANTSTGWRIYRNTGTSWNATYEQWASTAVFPLSTLSLPGGTVLSDINGDGLPDVVSSDTSKGWSVWLNTGTGFSSTATSWGDNKLPWLFTNNTTSGGDLLIDVNGDGLEDLVSSDITAGWKVWLNNGTSFNTTYTVWAPKTVPAFFINQISGGTLLADANGDGLPDVVDSRINGGGVWVYLNTGSGWNTTPQQWATTGPIFQNITYSGGTTLADVNGDGLLDWVSSSSNTWQVYLNKGTAPDLLTQAKNMSGGLTAFSYTPSTKFDNRDAAGISRLFIPLWLVEKRTDDNGMSGPHAIANVTTYSYKGGLYSPSQREYRGFAQVDETSSSAIKKQSLFFQDDALKGLLKQSQVTDAQGNLYAKTINTWNSALANGISTNTLTSVRNYTYDGSATNPKVAGIDYQYDSYGNVLKKSELGDINLSTDDKYTYFEYTYNPALWIVNKVKHTYLKGADDTTTISEKWNYYDAHANLDDAPTKGDLTKQVQLLSGQVNPVTQFEYDSFGNQTKVIDANNHATVYTYGLTDPTQTFAERITNAKNQQTTLAYDLGFGKVLSQTDPNGLISSYTYDEFGRISTEIQPYDSTSLPTTTYQYFRDGIAPEGVLVAKRKVSGATDVSNNFVFSDGLDRTIQTKTEAEDSSKQIVVDTFYNSDGQVAKETVPYLNTSSTSYTTPLSGTQTTSFMYDPVGRIKSTTNPKGDTATIAYDHWTTSKTDENGHKKKYSSDAYNNIIAVDEVDTATTYTTKYTYNALNEVSSVTDALGNLTSFLYDTLGRKISQTDPDMGQWSFAYDGANNLTKVTDGRGIVTTKAYDELNRLLKVDYPTSTDIVYTYDAGKVGTLASVTDDAGRVDYSYDNRLRKIQETRTLDGLSWVTKYAYNAQDQLIGQTNPDGEVITYALNRQGLIDSVSGVLTNIDYDAQGNIVKKDIANGLSTNYSYNTDDFRLNRITTGTLQDVGYTYDKIGNVAGVVDNKSTKTQMFGYDNLNRLISAQETGGYNYTYSYNAIGNLTSFTNAGTTFSSTYGENKAGIHALTSTTGTLGPLPVATPTNSPTPTPTATATPTFTPTLTPTPTVSRATLRGNVKDGVTGAALQGVRVYVVLTNPTPTAGPTPTTGFQYPYVYTDAQGNYVLSFDVGSGNSVVTLKTSRSGYNTAFVNTTITSSSDLTYNFLITAVGTSTPALTPTSTLAPTAAPTSIPSSPLNTPTTTAAQTPPPTATVTNTPLVTSSVTPSSTPTSTPIQNPSSTPSPTLNVTPNATSAR